MPDTKQTLKYPRSVFFIIGNEFCERFSYYGMRTILAFYFTSALRYDENTSTVLYHIFAMLCYFFPVFGAIIADSFFGKFKTIFYLSIVYAFGNFLLSLASSPILPFPPREVSLLGLLFIAIGTGGIKPCVSAFGGDQFILPQQEIQLQQYFSIFYFSINAGSLISTFLTPILRNDVQCFGQESCFPLAFGVPSILMVTALVIFVCGKPLYKIKELEGNIIVTVSKCITYAVKKRWSSNRENKEHWLDHADDKFTQQQISEIKAVLNVLYLFIPVPVFWALFDQQGSRWTFQAKNMDGRVFGYTIKPDQVQIINPLLILAFIPIFELYIYPMLKLIGIKRPLQKLTVGGFLAAGAFIISAILEFYVQDSSIALPTVGEGQLRLFNGLNCSVKLSEPIESVSQVQALSAAEFLHIPVDGSKTFNTKLIIDDSCLNTYQSSAVDIIVYDNKATSYFISENAKTLILSGPSNDNLEKNDDGSVKLRFFYSSYSGDGIQLKLQSGSASKNYSISNNEISKFVSIPATKYEIFAGSISLEHVDLNSAEIDTLLIRQDTTGITSKLVNMVPPNRVHMAWQLIQYVVITAAEIMFSITGLEFSFSQAPQSMKSVLSSAWLLTVAFGNLIVVVISEVKFFKSQAYEFLLFAGLMILDMILFIILSMKYTYVTIEEDTKKNDDVDQKSPFTSHSSLDE